MSPIQMSGGSATCWSGRPLGPSDLDCSEGKRPPRQACDRSCRQHHPGRSGGQLCWWDGRADGPIRAARSGHSQPGVRPDIGGRGMTSASTGLQLGRFGVWLNPLYGDDARTEYVIQAESLGFLTAWLGFGRASISDLALVERVLDETATITVATAIVNMWTNDAADIVEAYHRIAVRHGDRFLLGVGVGHPESITAYRQPYATMVDYLDQLDAGGVPADRRILAALGPRTMQLAADRTLGIHPYLVVPDHTREARRLLGPDVIIAPEHKVVLESDPEVARMIGRSFLADPYLKLRNYTNNLRRYGHTDYVIVDSGSDRLFDA